MNTTTLQHYSIVFGAGVLYCRSVELISMSDTDLIKDKLDIVDLISEYVQLKPSGINHKGVCPFHREKTPSFMVNKERQFFKCFGCGKSGDVFTFVQEMESMDFPEALKYLAARAGVILTNTFSDVASSQKNRIKDINTEAARFFHNFLLKMPPAVAGRARDYLLERGLSKETTEDWELGFVPEQWELLTQYLLKKGYGIDDLVASGLTIKRDGADPITKKGFYDRFRGRVMFPISDIHSAIVGFTGRVLVETENSGGKYVNTPQTLVYDKSRVVFGLDRAKQEIKAKDYIVMVEGQMDVIACHQAGMKNVVASSGTALTEHQVALLKRYSNNLRIAFDMDTAGQAAAKRGIDVAIAQGMNIRIIYLPENSGKDPDECLKKQPAVWFQAVAQAKDIMRWYFDRVFDKVDIRDPKEKQRVVNQLVPEILRIPYAVERDHWLQELAYRLGIETAVIREEMDRVKKNQAARYKGQETRYNNQNTANKFSENFSATEGKAIFLESSKLERLLEQWLILTLKFPQQLTSYNFQLTTFNLSPSPFFSLYEAIQKQYTSTHSLSIANLRETLERDNQSSLFEELLMKGELDFCNFQETEAAKEIVRLGKKIDELSKRERAIEIQRKIEQAELKQDTTAIEQLLKEFQQLYSV